MVITPQTIRTPESPGDVESLDSKFRFVLIAANRAEQLMRGARPKLDMPSRKPTVVAMREIEKNMVDWGYGQPAEEPLEAEPEGESAGA